MRTLLFSSFRHRRIEWLIKGGLILALTGLLYRQVEVNAEVWTAFRGAVGTNYWGCLLVTIILMPVNWCLEALKWRHFFRDRRALPFRRSIAGVLAGVTLALLTPLRLGDYGGRAMIAPAGEKGAALLATALSGYCQLIVVWGMGVVGASVFGGPYGVEWRPFVRPLIPYALALIAGLTIGVMYLPELLKNLDHLLPSTRAKRLLQRLMPLRDVPKKRLGGGLIIAALRYAVYICQYVLILRFFGIALPLPAAFSGAAVIFLVQTGLPLPPLPGLLVRGEIALLVWGIFGVNPLSILAATFSLFIINLFIPSLLGLVFIVQTKLLKSFSYEKNPD